MSKLSKAEIQRRKRIILPMMARGMKSRVIADAVGMHPSSLIGFLRRHVQSVAIVRATSGYCRERQHQAKVWCFVNGVTV